MGTVMTERIPVAPGLFAETPRGARLLGSRCGACGTHFFPRVPRCTNPACRSDDARDVELGPAGTLYSYTVQHYAPPPPFRYDAPFAPYAIGLVELREGIRVISMLKLDLAEVRLGMPLELVIDRMASDEQGRDVVTWKFAPATGAPR
jgi:uncharacterized OB-fold protein